MSRKRHIVVLALGVIFQLSIFNSARAEVWDSLCVDNYRIDTTDVGALKAEINALAFFQNNEFSSDIQKGYTLPGAWLQPKLTCTPIPQIHIEAGVNLLLFDGANRYPNYAYHDIVQWKGNQHTHGVHALPYLRLQAQLRKVNLVLGDIYGAQNHQLILPLFNPEQNLSADPEMGFQLLLDRPHVHLDTWINWQSYIFTLDTHQEAFTVGTNSLLKWNKDKNKPIQWETPIQVILQHRGGEIDVTNAGVQTVVNGSVGARMTYRPNRKTLTALRAEANLTGSWQQHGTLWPFDTGLAMHAALRAVLWKDLCAEVGYVGAPRQFANLYGSPFFGTISIRHEGMTFRGIHTAYANIGYAHNFTPAYRLGAQLNLYDANTHGSSMFTFGFGVYLRVCPAFVLRKGKK